MLSTVTANITATKKLKCNATKVSKFMNLFQKICILNQSAES